MELKTNWSKKHSFALPKNLTASYFYVANNNKIYKLDV